MGWYYCERCKEMRKQCKHRINETIIYSDNSQNIKKCRELLKDIKGVIRNIIDID